MNPLNTLLENYKNSVEENDQKGYAEKFKECACLMFKSLEDDDNYMHIGFHAEDIEYLDGYFIFGYGTNSVVHFHIKECPGWLFGVWWDIPNTYKNKLGEDILPDYINGEFFAQYENEIDKFKPSNSSIACSFSIIPGGEYKPDLFSVKRKLNFIHNEPELAFCMDYVYWDYNEEYHTREEAKEEFNNYLAWRSNKDIYEKECDDKLINFTKNKIIPMFKDSELLDRGSNWSPRYIVVAPLNSNMEIASEPGNYDIFSDCDDKVEKEFKDLIKECEDLSDKYKFIWFNPIDTCVNLYAEDK